MTLAGFPLGTLLAVGGAAAALVVVFYILKLRRRPVPVPFSPIWRRVLRDKEATTLFSQLKRLLSLLLQLALLALLVLALGDPRLTSTISEGRNVVVLVDTSASMTATDVSPNRLQRAKERARELARGLGGADRMLVAALGPTPTPLSTMTGEVSELEQAIDKLRAADTRADLARGLRFAQDSLSGLPKPHLVLISDGALGDLEAVRRAVDLGDTEFHYLPVGEGKRNVAISEFSARRYPLDKSRTEVMLELTNTNEQPAEVELTLLGDGEVIDITRLKLGANERLPRFYPDLAGASRTLEANIRLVSGEPDQLPADDRAYAVMPERRRARVLVVTEGNTYLEAALLLDEYLDVQTVAPAAYPPAGGRFDVTIFDGVAPPPVAASGGLLYLNPPKEGGPVELGRAIEMFGFDSWDKKSPLLRWMAMGDIQVLRGHALKPGPDDRVIGKSDLGPLLVSGRRDGQAFVALGFDPRNSDFVLRVAWPLFVLNTVNAFVEEDTSYVSSFRTGQVWNIPVPGSAERAELELPGGGKVDVPVKDGYAVFMGERAGVYALRAGAEAEQQLFAANLGDVGESFIEPQKELTLGGKPPQALAGFDGGMRRELWLYLVLAAILLSTIEWVTYHRRVTV